ncbi:MAG: vWA domain-containing protein, partial [Opitutaceae bacterium]
ARPVGRSAETKIALQPAGQEPASAPSPIEALPAETRVADASLPPLSTTVPGDTATTTERPDPGVRPSVAPAFVERDLSLIGQATQVPVTPARDDIARSEVEPASTIFSSEVGVSRETGVAAGGIFKPGRPPDGLVPGMPLTLNDARSAASSRARGGILSQTTPGAESAVASEPASPVHPLFSAALAPPVAAPVVASSTPPSLLPGQAATARSPSIATNLPGSGDVVMLSPFTVSEDRATGFALSSSRNETFSDQRNALNRDDRPHAPPGAKFGRNTEAYSYIRDNGFLSAAQNRVSTFAIDVAPASYANIRRIIEHGSPPPRDAVRIEEMLNYFPYRYAPPAGDTPFAVSLEVADAPWAPAHRIVRIGLKAREVATAQRPPANLVFLLDVSGSMDQPNKLPLVKQSLRWLLGRLRGDDRVAIVTYAGNSGLALASTPVAQAREIMNALDALTPAGSTNGAMGIQLAYEIARANFAPAGINRVILCTDGDFNMGMTSEGELVRLIEEKATSGVFLTVLGFGMGNYKDSTLEKLANTGNGNYGYIDTQREAEKLLVEQVGGTLVTVAKDVKLQVAFNPAAVSSYRLIGYENRLLRKEDFNDDKADAGDVGAGHTVTALYEIVPVKAKNASGTDAPSPDDLSDTSGTAASRLHLREGDRDASSDELLTVKVRYKKPDSLFSFPRTLQ